MTSARQLFKSLQFQLIFWSVLLLLILAVVAGGYGFWSSYQEINDFQDDNLKNTAALLEQSLNINRLDNAAASSFEKAAKYDIKDHSGASDSNQSSGGNKSNSHSTFQNIHFDTDDEDGAITVDIISLSASSLTRPTRSAPPHQEGHHHHDSTPIASNLLNQIPDGISDQKLDGHSWRTYRSDVSVLRPDASGVEEVAIILRQQTDLQDDLAKASAWQSFLPLIIGMGLLTLLLPFIMWRMFKPVRQLHNDINNRHENDLSPLVIDNLPSELMPLAQSMNSLLDLVKSSIERQQRFIADAAHELRSPLTAISLQLQRLQRQNNDELTAEGLNKLAIRLQRNQRLVEQLLTLARAGNINVAADRATPSISVSVIIEQVIGLLIPIADNKDIDLSVNLLADDTNQSSALVQIDETSLLLLIKNLIQNALVYSPNGGQVVVTLERLPSSLGDKAAVIGHKGAFKEAITDTSKTHKDTLSTATLSSVSKLQDFGTQVIGSKVKSDFSQRLAGRLVLQIMDSGKGITPNHYSEAFEPFVRFTQSTETDATAPMSQNITAISKVDNILNTKANPYPDMAVQRSDSAGGKQDDIEGTGLGLSIVKTICEQTGIEVFMNRSILCPTDSQLHSAASLKDALNPKGNVSPKDTLGPKDNAGLCVTLVF
ncbi:MAG: histidine kinase dimerization/phospho-acceptor domain-containing protein [Psychrobacter sp.]|nr:histidine kinase dimerization/phospho-acceptor domain-containing protein [Psychrobacter sp.]